MTAINDLVEVAGTIGASGRLGALNEAVAGIRVPFNIIYESLPSMAVRLSPVSAIGITQMAGADGMAEQALPVDIYSLIEEIQRSISELKARTASVPDIYTYYILRDTQVPVPPGMPGPVLTPVDRLRPEYISEQAEPLEKIHEGHEFTGIVPDDGIIRSNIALDRLRDDFVELTWDLAEVERLIGEAMRSSAADIPAIVSAKAAPVVQETSVEYIERPAPETVVTEKTIIVKEDTGKEKAREASRHDAALPGLAKLASVLAQGISLPGIIQQSTVEMMVMQTVLAAESPAPVMITPLQAAIAPTPVAAPEAGTSSVTAPAVSADKVSARLPAPSTPVAQAVDIARAFNSVISSYLALRGTAPRRMAMQEGVTQLLLSLPEQQAANRPVSGLFDVMAGLQAARPRPMETLPPIEVVARAPVAAAPELPENEPMQSTILGDLRDMQGKMAALQDAVGGLQRAGMPAPEVQYAAEALSTTGFEDVPVIGLPAAAPQASEDVSGKLLDIYVSIARLQAAMDYLRVNVPTLADLVVLQKAVAGVPPVPAAAMPESGTPVAIAIEGVQPKSAAPISLPDLSWVSREFGQMQGMIARLQVPMYAEGGLVEQPTLAFVGEAEPEWIVPMSAWDESQSKLNEFYSMLWSQIQELGTSMQETVGGVNTALEGLQAAGEEGSDSDTLRSKFTDLMDNYVDDYLGPIGFSMENLKSLGTATGISSMSLGTLHAILPRVKSLFTEDEEEEKEASGGGKEEAKEEDDEEDFWKMIDDLDKAASISDKRKGKFESE